MKHEYLPKIKSSIVFKIILMIVVLLSSVTFFVSYKNSELFMSVSLDREEGLNMATVEAKSLEIETLIKQYIDKTQIFSSAALSGDSLVEESLEKQDDFFAIKIFEIKNNKSRLLISKSKRNENNLQAENN